MTIHRTFAFLTLLFLSTGAFVGCGNSAKQELPKDVIATVNKEPILASELKSDLAIRLRMDPLAAVTPEMEQDQLDLIIDKKLIIQSAVAQGLTRDEQFVNTIKTFWEQTLVREFLEHKKREFAANLKVSEADIQEYYARLGRRVTFMVFKAADKEAAEVVYAQWKNEGKIDPTGWKVVGPVTYAELDSEVLRAAFTAEVNAVVLVSAPTEHYLVMVQNRQEIPLQPLDLLRPAIERDILTLKEQTLLDEWLKNSRQQADINILKQ